MLLNLVNYNNIVLLLLRFIVALIFIDSGRRDLQDPLGRGQSMGSGKNFAIFLGAVEVLGGLGLLFGVLTQLAAIGLILVMLGAIQKKAFVWKTGFWGKKDVGWHYELMLIIMNLVILVTAGGGWVLVH